MSCSHKATSILLLSLCLFLATVISNPVMGRSSSSNFQTGETAEEEIRRVVTESQFNETLVIYVYPATFDKALLTKYWVPENKGGKAITQVENSVRRLLDKRWRYAKESANEEFAIRSVTFFPPGDVADVTTRERWYLPMVDEHGRLVKDREATLEFTIRYRLIRVDGRWLILHTSVPYRDRN